MFTPRNLWQELCSYQNLEFAYKKARKHKTLKEYVMEFEENLDDNLSQLHSELLLHGYRPKLLTNFIIRDPKTRKISKSDFRDRVVHHALCNVIEPIFEKAFILDSYANQKGKGTLKAIKKFDWLKRKASGNNTKFCYLLKADIKKYFENVDHKILMKIIKRRIKDKKILWLIKLILSNAALRERERERERESDGKPKKGMPLGNLTSQFFANVYLNELDYFVKHELKAKYYIRYVDDFIILHSSKEKLKEYKTKINAFLRDKLRLELHQDKSKILMLDHRINFLGFRIFYYHKLIKKQNYKTFERKLRLLCSQYDKKLIDYDVIYDFLEGWCAYARNVNTNKLRKVI